jgi:hypothetical protein
MNIMAPGATIKDIWPDLNTRRAEAIAVHLHRRALRDRC